MSDYDGHSQKQTADMVLRFVTISAWNHAQISQLYFGCTKTQKRN